MTKNTSLPAIHRGPKTAALLIAAAGVLYACSGDDSSAKAAASGASSGSATGATSSGAGGSGTSSSSGAGGKSEDFDRTGLITSIADNVIMPTYRDFVTAAEALETAAKAHAASLDPADFATTQSAWDEAMDIWQRAEVLQIGPAGPMVTVIAGEDLRDEIYSWPTVNACRVDQEVVEQVYLDKAAFAAELPNVRGLDALEYLLFFTGATNACAPQNTINTSGDWDAMTPEELTQRRADYAVTAAGLLVADAIVLRDAWEPSGKNFFGELVGAGSGSTTYATTQEALNSISSGMFYLETITKDLKVGPPAAITGCDVASCPEKLESQWAKVSKKEIRANIVAFQQVFLGAPAGTEALGFDDYLVAKGADALATTMTNDIVLALAAADAIEEASLEDALTADLASVVDLYNAIKAITDNLKTQFIAVLDLDLPKNLDGDND